MKLKQATQMAIIGVILIVIPTILWTLSNFEVLTYFNQELGKPNWYFEYLNVISLIGELLLLPFFITLYKNQK